MSIGFASNYTYLHQIKDQDGNWLYLGPGISTIEWENEDETDDTAYYDSGGAMSEDVTGVKIAATVSGHRYNGDPAQDYIASRLTEIGDGRVTEFRRIAPDGAILEGPVTVKDIVDGGGEANEKATFECGLAYRQMPKYVPPSSHDMPQTVSFDEGPLTLTVGQTMDLSQKVKVTPEGATPNCVFALDDESMDSEKAMVDAAGILTAKGEGEVKVTAKCISKPAATATATITITGSDWREPTVKEAKVATKADFDEVLRGLGKSDDKNVGEPVIYILMDSPLDKATDYLVTVAVKGKTYGLTRPHGGDYIDDSVIYFSLTNGHQVDFVDQAKKQSDEEAACDLSDYSGQAVVTLYKTDDQTEGTYPTGLEQIKQETIQISNGD